jgi:hypothetical protein
MLLVLASAVPLGSESHILLFQFLRLPQPGGPGPRIYIPQEQGGPDIPLPPPGTGFPLCRIFRLVGLQWRYSILPPHGVLMQTDRKRREIAYDNISSLWNLTERCEVKCFRWRRCALYTNNFAGYFQRGFRDTFPYCETVSKENENAKQCIL